MCSEKNNNLCNIDKYSGYNIGNRIKEAAFAQNITIKELCNRAGLSVNYINQMTSDNRQPRAVALANIADVLAVSVDALLDRPAPVIPGSPNLANLDTAVSVVAAAADLPPDYIRGILHLPPRSSTTNDI